jgi:hypothetical protein
MEFFKFHRDAPYGGREDISLFRYRLHQVSPRQMESKMELFGKKAPSEVLVLWVTEAPQALLLSHDQRIYFFGSFATHRALRRFHDTCFYFAESKSAKLFAQSAIGMCPCCGT